MPGRFGPVWSAAVSVAVVCTAVLGLVPGGPGAAIAGQYAPHPIPESERWATITHPGNEPYRRYFEGQVVSEYGRVNYEFQIARTEVTYAEWFEFVQACGPYIDPAAANFSGFTGQAIVRTAPGVYTMSPGVANLPVEIAWDYAARYCNWLHNGKANTPEAFERGAYETSTFEYVPGGFHHQQSRSPGARYWIPSRDEWIKSAHFDPNKNGPGQPGYWLYPHSSDEPPMSGPPGVGQTSTGGAGGVGWPAVASYTTVQSPWGLWDASGGAREWTETVFFFRPDDVLPSGWNVKGTGFRDNGIYIPFYDNIEGGPPLGLGLNPEGLRIARSVPAPTCLVVFVLGFVVTNRRR